jgi:hypothetical protein
MFDFTKQWEARVIINGRPVTEYHHQDGNVYLEGRKGSEYELEFINHSYEQILVVPAVDGLSVMDGKSAGLDSDGYVVNSRSTLRIPGWRLDQNNVAKFVFGDLSSGYSAQSGQGSANSGVIGFMVFRSQAPALNPFEVHTYYSGNSTAGIPNPQWSAISSQQFGPSCDNLTLGSSITRSATLKAPEVKATITDYSISVNPELATGFGRKDNFNTVDVTFNKRDPHNPDSLLVLYYDSLRGLEKRGVVVRKETVPHAFPRYSSSKGCKTPPNWRG